MIAEIAREVVAQDRGASARAGACGERRVGDGVFATVDEAGAAASEAQESVAAMSLDERGRIIDIIAACAMNAPRVGAHGTGGDQVGRLDHKIEKLKIRFVLGVESLRSQARTDDSGLCVIERAPWGVIGMMLPVTHSVPTMASNAINMIAAGNTAVFGPHPVGPRCGRSYARHVQPAIERETGRFQCAHHHSDAEP